MADKKDVYSRITDKIIADLEQGVRPWVKPWNTEHAAGKITRPLRYNGQPYSGINILNLWMDATEKGFSGFCRINPNKIGAINPVIRINISHDGLDCFPFPLQYFLHALYVLDSF